MVLTLLPYIVLVASVLLLGGLLIYQRVWYEQHYRRLVQSHVHLRQQLRGLAGALVKRHKDQRALLAGQEQRLAKLLAGVQVVGELGETLSLLSNEVETLKAYTEHQAQLLQTLYTLLARPSERPEGLGVGVEGNTLPILPRSMVEFGAPTPDYALETTVEPGRPPPCADHQWEERSVIASDANLVARVEAIDYCPRCASKRRRRIR